MSESIIRFDGVTRRYGAVTAVQGVSFDIERGAMFGLIGADGAGKTTTIRLMAGLLTADAGRVRIVGHDPVREHRRITAHVGYLSQRFSLYGDLSIDENIAFFARIHGIRDFEDRRSRLLDLTQLTPFRHRLAERLSGGMKQKLALVCTLVHEPDVLLLDEPTTGVDPVARREFWKLLSQLLAQRMTIVMATPYLDEAERCGRVALLHEGRLLALDRPTALRDAFEGDIVEVIASPHREAPRVLARVPEFADHQTFGERLHVRLRRMPAEEGMAQLRRRLETAGLTVASVRRVAPSLEDVFIERLRTLDTRPMEAV